LQSLEVDLEAELSGSEKAFDIVADEKAAYRQATILFAANNRVNVNNRQMAKEVVGGVVEHIANRIFRTAHDAFHPVDRAEIVAAIDPFAAAGPYQNVLGIVGHTDNFVRHHLA